MELELLAQLIILWVELGHQQWPILLSLKSLGKRKRRTYKSQHLHEAIHLGSPNLQNPMILALGSRKSYIVMECFGFIRVFMCITSFRCRTVEIPKYTRQTKGKAINLPPPGVQKSRRLTDAYWLVPADLKEVYHFRIHYLLEKRVCGLLCSDMHKIFINIYSQPTEIVLKC